MRATASSAPWAGFKAYTIAVVYFWVVMVVAHLAAPDSYDWTRHTISQLAVRGYQSRWIMQAGLAGFGILLLYGAIDRIVREPARRWTDGAVAISGACLALSAVFSTRPFLLGTPCLEAEATAHAVVGTASRIAAALSIALSAILEKPGLRKRVHIAALGVFVVLAVSLEFLTDGFGIAQRVLFLAGSAWLVFTETPVNPVGGREGLSDPD